MRGCVTSFHNIALNNKVCLHYLFEFGFQKSRMNAGKSLFAAFKNVGFSCHRQMSVRARKRFYANVDVVSSGNQYEVTLDSKKLKTPNGSVFCVHSEPLALAVAQEWAAQKDNIMLSQMHLTGLSNVCLDNPTKTTKYALVDDILKFLDTDTILFFSDVTFWLKMRSILC